MSNSDSTTGKTTYLGSVRARRLAAGLSQERLARLADCSLSTVRLAERGLLPGEEISRRLATALECDPRELRDESRAPA
jgi:transcriptional regulator with XRE-family HTH domain